MFEWGTGGTMTDYLAIVIGGDIIPCSLYADYGQEKGG